MEHPCYKCPDRNAECHATCEKWRAYEVERNKEYERIGKEKELARVLYLMERDRKRDIALGKMKRRRSKRTEQNKKN